MKKIFMALGLLGAIYHTSVIADPTVIPIHFVCPSATGVGIHVLVRYSNRISGYGTETINGNPSFNSPLFNFNIPIGANIPKTLSTYSNSGTDFDFITGIVSCSFTSSGGFAPFTTTYQMTTNTQGGQIASQTTNTITINQYVGIQ